MRLAVCGLLSVGALTVSGTGVGVYTHAMNPREHPDDQRRHVQPPDAQILGNKIHFTSCRNMSGPEGVKAMEKWLPLGDFMWLHSGFVRDAQFEDKVREIRRRGLYLFDLWGFVPGNAPDVEWKQFRVEPATVKFLEHELGDHWLGMDNGEQDGRYTAFASMAAPTGMDRYHQYLNFQRYFERLTELQGNRMATLVSLNFGHYFLKEGLYSMIGAETAQGLPNAQVYYSWIRGAGKQYGVPWFGNVSVYNRWGWKNYGVDKQDPNSKHGPERGASLALMKKLMMSQLFYNCSVLGFESGHFDRTGSLSPIGRIQMAIVDWLKRNGSPGVMHVPVALMVDFMSGWAFPRHLYSGSAYRVWGTLPYESGDYLTAGVLGLLYPGYEDSSYYHDERGFNTPTPFGDIADCVLSDIPAWQLKAYPLVVLAGRITPGEEIRDTLTEYVKGGGELVMTRGNAEALFPTGLPNGRVTVISGAPWGVVEEVSCPLPCTVRAEHPLGNPHPLTTEARMALEQVFRRQAIFTVPSPLSLVTCRRGKGEYTVLVGNESWKEQHFSLTAAVGKIVSLTELQLDSSERKAPGYMPIELKAGFVCGADTDTTIAAGAVRAFRVTLDEAGGIRELPKIVPRANPRGRYLALRGMEGVKERILARPTFFRHCDGVMVDGIYLENRDGGALEGERKWLDLQKVNRIVDLTSSIELFPGYRLQQNDSAETERSRAAFVSLLAKAKIWGAKEVIIALHRRGDAKGLTEEAFRDDVIAAIRWFCRTASAQGIAVHLRADPRRAIRGGSYQSLVDAVGESNLQLAPMVGNGIVAGKLLWFAGAPLTDPVTGSIWSQHVPLADAVRSGVKIGPYISHFQRDGVRVVYDALYPDVDSEYRDFKLLEQEGTGE